MWRVPTPLPFRPPQVHAYLARLDGGGWMLIDGGIGTDEAWAALDAGVREAADGWGEVRLLVLTHMHMDHVGLAARTVEASGARVLMGALDAERMRHAALHPDDEAEYRLALLRRCGAPQAFIDEAEGMRGAAQPLAPPVRVDEVLRGERGDVPSAPGWRWEWTPGHTAGHVSLFRPSDAVLVAGDAVLPKITPTLGVNRQREDPVGDYLAALERLEALSPRLVLPGHGEAPADGRMRIRELGEAARAETETVLALLDAADATCWEAVERRYAGRDLPVGARMLALRETLAHLDRLAAAGRAARRADDGGAERFSPLPQP